MGEDGNRDPFGNDDNVEGAGEPLVMVKFDDAVGIITEAEDNDDSTAVAELTGGGVSEGETRFPVSLDSKEVSGMPVGSDDINSLLETWSSPLVILTGSAVGSVISFVTAGTKHSLFSEI